MTGWAHYVDADLNLVKSLFGCAFDLDPENHDARSSRPTSHCSAGTATLSILKMSTWKNAL